MRTVVEAGARCPGENEVADFLAGDGTEAEREKLRGHLDCCEGCRALLAALVGPASAREVAAPTVAALLAPGTVVGPYRVLELIGSGGMGVVYAAFDPRLDRKVALKLIRPELSLVDPELERRLIRESKAMARLFDPHVLAVHDIGMFGGQVYVAMDLVEGQTLRAWLRARPGWREVLVVFVQAGQGLAAAHQAGLVHRDFKPDNVLLDRSGRVLVTDFGLARPVGAGSRETPTTRASTGTDDDTRAQVGSPGATAIDAALTLPGALVGTPAYMAPEQRRGEAADERSDVFSFCVALYEGLYGVRPAIDSPAGVQPPARDVRVPGWLRRAVLRGLEPVPSRRYPSMAALLAVLSLRRPVFLYMSLGACLLVAGAGSIAALVGGEADEQRSICAGAEVQLARAWSDERRAVVREARLADDGARAQFVWGRVEAALDEHTAAWRRVHGELCGLERAERSTALRFGGARCLTARAVELAAATTVLSRKTGVDGDRALAVIDGLRSADACLRPGPDEDRVRGPADVASRAEVEAIRAALAEVEALADAGALAEARARVEPLVRRARALGYRPLELEVVLRQGVLEANAGDPHLGARIVRRAANSAEANRYDRLAAEAWSFLVFHAAQGLGDLERADEYAEHAEAALERIGGDLDLTAQIMHHRGVVAWRAGDAGAALEWFERSAEMTRQTGREPRVDLLEGIALAYSDEGRFTVAAQQFAHVLALRREQFGPEHPDLGITHCNVAAVLHELGRDDEALAHLHAAMAVHVAAYGPDHFEAGHMHSNIGEVLRALGRHEEGLVHNGRASAILREVHGDEHPDVAALGEHRAGLYLGLGRHEEAIALLREALAVFRRTRGERDPLVARCQLNLGEALRRAHRADEALALEREGLAQFEALLPASSAYLGYARTAVGRTLIALGREYEALPLLEGAVAGYPATDVHPFQVAVTQAALAEALWAVGGDQARALQLARTAQTTLIRGGAGWRFEREAVERWLAALPAGERGE